MATLDSGLSSRVEKTLKEFRPAFASATAAPQPNQVDSAATVDLSSAQNDVLRPELLEFFKSTVEDRVTSEVFALPAPDGGCPELRKALASFFNKYFHPVHTVKSEHIVLTAGASDAIENVIHTVCDDGDSVLVPGPSWHGFTPLLKARANVNIVVAQPPTYANWDNYLVPSLQAVYDFSADKSRIKAVLLCNPHNPLSRCYPKKTLLELMEFCQENSLHLIVDELYALTDLSDNPPKAPPFVSALSLTEPLVRSGALKVDPSRVHVIWSASKLFGISGFRVGCVISQSNTPLLTALSLLTTSHVNTTASTYLTSLLTWPQLPTLLALNTERRSSSYRMLASALTKWNVEFVPPSHGLFLFARLAKRARNEGDERRFYEALRREGVCVGEGRLYTCGEGEFGWARVRFSVGGDVMAEGVRRIERFLEAQG